MFTFITNINNCIQGCCCSIEENTRLLLIEQQRVGEKYPRYIRLTGQQINRTKQLFFKGNFRSDTKPSNSFSLDNGTIVMCCAENKQVIRLSLEDMGRVYQYYERHKDRIAKHDCLFRK